MSLLSCSSRRGGVLSFEICFALFFCRTLFTMSIDAIRYAINQFSPLSRLLCWKYVCLIFIKYLPQRDMSKVKEHWTRPMRDKFAKALHLYWKIKVCWSSKRVWFKYLNYIASILVPLWFIVQYTTPKSFQRSQRRSISSNSLCPKVRRLPQSATCKTFYLVTTTKHDTRLTNSIYLTHRQIRVIMSPCKINSLNTIIFLTVSKLIARYIII